MSHEPEKYALYNTDINKFIKKNAPTLFVDNFLNSDSHADLKQLKNQKLYIINTAKGSTKKGEHWVSLYKINEKVAYYFDPIGYSPCNRYWHIGFLSPTEIAKSGMRIISPQKNYMDPYGTVCGEYNCVLSHHIQQLLNKGEEKSLLQLHHEPFEDYQIYPANKIHGTQRVNDERIVQVYKNLLT